MKAILWGYRFSNMRETWYKRVQWMVNSLLKYGIEVKPHPNFKCRGLNLPLYDFTKDHNADICIYNHADISCLTGNVLQVKKNWFFKPTVPDENHTTLDEMGYGPYSSITYKKPNFEQMPQRKVNKFFSTKVKNWITKKTTKWGNRFKNDTQKIEETDYHLILGQCGGDEVVTRHDFGHYFTKMKQIVRELARIDNRLIIVKLHPYTDGEHATNNNFSMMLKQEIEAINPAVRVFTGKVNIHNFIKNARCIFLANSGAGFEAMMHHKPIISWGYPEYHWVTYDLRHLADLLRAIRLDWFNAEKSDKFLYWYMEKHCFYNQETSDRRIKELLENDGLQSPGIGATRVATAGIR